MLEIELLDHLIEYIDKVCLQIMYLIYVGKHYLALNNQ